MAKTIDLRKKTQPESDALHDKAVESQTPGVDLIAWTGPLIRHSPNMKAIWLTVVVIWLIAVAVQVFQKNIVTTIFFSLLGLMILIQAKKKPYVAKMEFSPLGIKIGGQSHTYRELKSFWLDYQPSQQIKEISLHFKKWYLPYIKIPIGDQNPVQLRSFLIQFIPEVEHEETLADVLGRRLGL